jgi:hypothetical protein
VKGEPLLEAPSTYTAAVARRISASYNASKTSAAEGSDQWRFIFYLNHKNIVGIINNMQRLHRNLLYKKK